MTSQLVRGTARVEPTQWRDKKRYLWLMGAVAPPPRCSWCCRSCGGMNQLGWTAASQVFFGSARPDLHAAAGAGPQVRRRDGQNPPDEVMEYLENDKYYRYCTYIFIPFQYASLIFGALHVHRVEPELARLRRRPQLVRQDRSGALGWRARRHRHQHRPRTGH